MDLRKETVAEFSKKVNGGWLAPDAGCKAAGERIGARDEELNCFVTVTLDRAEEQARELAQSLQAGRDTKPLAGVPIAIKDNICTRGIRTTCGSKILENYVPAYDATVVERLTDAGALMVGKTNLDEFAMGSTTETSFFGPTRNPRDITRAPGGSSGGSAAAVAAGECLAALGSDTGGSVRLPAAHCGIVGFKPTYGSVSRYGLIAYASSLDQIGVLAGNVEDCAKIWQVIAGRDPKDATSMDPRGGKELRKPLSQDYGKLRIGIPRDFFGEGLEMPVRKAVERAIDLLAGAGAEVEEFHLGLVDSMVPVYYTIAMAEASSNLARYDGVKYGMRADSDNLHAMYGKTRSQGFGEEVKRRILVGAFVLSEGYYDAYYLKALKIKRKIVQALGEAFRRYDLILSPTAPTTAPKLGESLRDPLKMYLGDLYTVCANLAGLPAISIPCGADEQGMPVGLQLMADRHDEATLFAGGRLAETICGEGRS